MATLGRAGGQRGHLESGTVRRGEPLGGGARGAPCLGVTGGDGGDPRPGAGRGRPSPVTCKIGSPTCPTPTPTPTPASLKAAADAPRLPGPRPAVPPRAVPGSPPAAPCPPSRARSSGAHSRARVLRCARSGEGGLSPTPREARNGPRGRPAACPRPRKAPRPRVPGAPTATRSGASAWPPGWVWSPPPPSPHEGPPSRQRAWDFSPRCAEPRSSSSLGPSLQSLSPRGGSSHGGSHVGASEAREQGPSGAGCVWTPFPRADGAGACRGGVPAALTRDSWLLAADGRVGPPSGLTLGRSGPTRPRRPPRGQEEVVEGHFRSCGSGPPGSPRGREGCGVLGVCWGAGERPAVWRARASAASEQLGGLLSPLR
ncbi:translation initiation factor IF-2-like [Canis lupus dingo]|uniref:translation initiation factor IF-2-like n=1 Tax=Canis lupus dingo TaxID=286419 RepID=UPI0020C4F31C|nr:translation initiation factor IF-2-like [Canis lupus dingo]